MTQCAAVDHTSKAFIDFLMIYVACLVTIIVLMQNNPPSKPGDPPPGQIVVEILWPLVAADVDLWVRAPNEQPVGYSNKHERTYNLLRDDRGVVTDHSNHENVYGRGAPDGEHRANVHMYANTSHVWPIPVRWRAYMLVEHGKIMIGAGEVNLLRTGEEITLIAWRMHHGRVVAGSQHSTFTPLRQAYPEDGGRQGGYQ